jgi:hypothetical protein
MADLHYSDSRGFVPMRKKYPADKIGRAKLVMDAIDNYHDRPSAANRTAIRVLLMDLLPDASGVRGTAAADVGRDLDALEIALSWVPFDRQPREALARVRAHVAGVKTLDGEQR